MSSPDYIGRHRPARQPPRGRRLLVPATLLGAAVATAVVARDVGASPLDSSASAASSGSALTMLTAAGAGSAASADAVSRGEAAAAIAARGGADRVSRDAARAEQSTLQASAKAAQTAAAKAAADKAAATKAAADKAAATKAAADKAAAAHRAATSRQPAGIGGGTGNPGPDRTTGPIGGDRRWVTPFSGYTLTSGFGARWGKMHNGQDMAAALGTPVRALSSGKVLFAGWDNTGYGNFVKVQYWDGTVVWYAHNGSVTVSVGQSVSPGQTVALSGNSGNSTGPHLHLEIHPGGGGAVSPQGWLAAKGINI